MQVTCPHTDATDAIAGAQHSWTLEESFMLATNNTAAFLKLPTKGCLAPGCDGDVLLLTADTLELQYVFAGGVAIKTPSYTAQGMFTCT